MAMAINIECSAKRHPEFNRQMITRQNLKWKKTELNETSMHLESPKCGSYFVIEPKF